METDERPSKIRRLNDEEQQSCKDDKIIGSTNPVPASSKDAHVPQNGTTLTPDQITSNRNSASDVVDRDTAHGKHEDDYQDCTDFEHDAELPAPDEIAPFVDAETQHDAPKLSKSQQKKLRKRAEWDSKREERKIIRKEKQVAKRERKRAEKKQQAEQEPATTQGKHVPQKAITLPVTIVIDCDFDGLMRDHERVSLAAQITRSYSDNRNSPFRAHLTICSFGGKLRERFDNVLTHYKSWRGVRALDSDFVETADKARAWMTEEKGGELAGAFSKYVEMDETGRAGLKNAGEVVYLSSEADEDLLELKPYSTYIIGGLVDKNREKGICHKRAVERGIRTARLPIREYMDMQSRKVLATNHVNEIMVKWLECGDWGQAFLKAIPKRKGGQLKDTGTPSEAPAEEDRHTSEDKDKQSDEEGLG